MNSDELRSALGLSGAGKHRRLGRWVLLSAVVVVLALAILYVRTPRGEAPPAYQTEEVRTGPLSVTVTATGELTPVTQVNIGTEISGVVESVNVDFNSRVRAGQILARVNTDKLQAQVAQARAALQSAQAKQQQTEATLTEAQTSLERLRTVRELSGGKVPSQQEFDAQAATVKRAVADVASAVAQVTQSEASLAAIETDVNKAVIRSPINGIVLDRQIDPGQTVAASFQTPTLFTLAEDLTKMRLIVAVDEADIGQVKVGQAAHFRVDAYPDREFVSTVTEVRSAPTTTGGIVTYQTVLAVDNAGALLQPGMTATADIIVTHIDEALLVSNAALRFTPPAAQAQGQSGGLLPSPPGNRTRDRDAESAGPRVWILEGDQLRAIAVTTGASDGRVTVVNAGDLKPGMMAIVDLAVGG